MSSLLGTCPQEFKKVLENIGIKTDVQRLAHIVMYAELGALIVSGPRRGKQFTYALLEERAPNVKRKTREEALVTLTEKYFRSHGPAQLKDFSWWSGLTMNDAKEGIAMLKSKVQEEVINGKTYYFFPTVNYELSTTQSAFLLSIYDEYTIAYKDRSGLSEERYIEKFIQMGNALTAVIVLKGMVVGTWKRILKKKEVFITLNLLKDMSKKEMEEIKKSVTAYGAFHGLPVNMEIIKHKCLGRDTFRTLGFKNMSHETNKQRCILPKLSKGNYNTLVKLISNSLTFSVSDCAKFRLHVLDHYFKHGIVSTCHAFNLPRSTVYGWRKSFLNSKRQVSSLIPQSTRPKRTRQMGIDLKLLEFIKSMREEYGNLSKYKIKPFLDEYAKENNLPLYGTTKIGVIIKRRKFFYETRSRRKFKRKPFVVRLKRSPKETVPGYIEMDSVIIQVLNQRYYFLTAIDIVTKFAWVKMTTNHSSRQAKLALIEFMQNYKYELRTVQTDNGTEFLGEFDEYLTNTQIKHEFIYLKSPKINGVVERFNRTIQEEFIQRNDDIIFDRQKFNEKLEHYLIWYNTKRPHYSLGQVSPYEYMQRFT